ncbi:MAG: hypothetical protein WC928_00785 [Patescibacteria group bacterium]|jgi:hypothetical protein
MSPDKSFGINFISVSEPATASSSSLLWPILALVVVGGVVVFLAYKYFFN